MGIECEQSDCDLCRSEGLSGKPPLSVATEFHAEVKTMPYYVVADGPTYKVMGERELMANERAILASRSYDRRREAELALKEGLADGAYRDDHRRPAPHGDCDDFA